MYLLRLLPLVWVFGLSLAGLSPVLAEQRSGAEKLSAQARPSLVGVSDSAMSEYHWVMHCRGCHQADATGSAGGAQNMAGEVSKFLHSQKGRAYLASVPGVAFVSLPDKEVAELLNWMVQTFDKDHLPTNFSAYTEQEVAELRKTPLVAEAAVVRDRLLKTFQP